MNPLDTIEKWISEHGSAAILRDHVALLKEQIAISDREKSALKSEVASIKTERDTFKATIAKLQMELEDACKEIESLKQPKTPGVMWSSRPRIKGRMEM
jgi:chromosome segregation ATPase